MAVPVITDKYIIIRVKPAEGFEPDSFRTLWVDQDAGIQEIMGKRLKNDENEVQSYIFDKNKYTIEEAKKWVKKKFEEHRDTRAEALAKKRSFVVAKMQLCANQPNLRADESPPALTAEGFEKNQSQANLNDRYFFFVEGVHEGMNGNGDHFSEEELTRNYKSAGYQLLDWEHQRDQVIGFSLDSELLSRPDQPLALAFTGIISRLSPHMQVEEREGSEMILRDDLVRQRFFEGKLAVSMECFFDSMKCMECGFETGDPLDFEFHTMLSHKSILEAGDRVPRGLIGVDFVGWGLVGHPADPEAFIPSLRTSDDGLIEPEIMVPAEDEEKYGILAGNVAFAKMVAKVDPTDMMLWDPISKEDRFVFASDRKMLKTSSKHFEISDEGILYVPMKEKESFDTETIERIVLSEEDNVSAFVGYRIDSGEVEVISFGFPGSWTLEKAHKWIKENADKHEREEIEKKKKKKKKKKKTKKSTKNNIKTDKLDRRDTSSKGGLIMFKLNDKISSSMAINDAFAVALRTLKDFQGDRALEPEEVDAFIAEFVEVVKTKLNNEAFRVSDIYTLTDSDKLEAIEAARVEEKTAAEVTLAELQTKYDALTVEKKGLEEIIVAKDEELSTMKTAEEDKEKSAKVDQFIKEVKQAGVVFTESFEVDVRSLATAKLGEKEEELLKSFRGDLVATVKRSELTAASQTMGGGTAAGDADKKGMSARLDKVQEDHNKK